MYYIYHIKGIKIGCSKRPKQRVKEQGYSEYELLEQHSDIELASKREIELQNEYGYYEKFTKVDYKHSIQNWQYKSTIVRKGTKHSDNTKMKIKIKAIGNHNKPTIPVIVYDKENNIVGEYNSISEAADILNVHQNNICHMLNGRLKSTGGYIFKRRNN